MSRAKLAVCGGQIADPVFSKVSLVVRVRTPRWLKMA